MHDHTEAPHNTFVIRFWREWNGADAGPTPGWRGRIDHVQSGEGLSFRDPRELLTFIGRFIQHLPASQDDDAPATPLAGYSPSGVDPTPHAPSGKGDKQ